MASVYGMLKLGYPPSQGMEPFISIVEINNCFTDGIQVISGCTLGNNRLIFRDFGKMAVTFILKGKKALHIWVKPGYQEKINNRFPHFSEIHNRVIKQQKQDTSGIKEWLTIAREASFFLITHSPGEILNSQEVDVESTDYGAIHDSVFCSQCKEQVMKPKAINMETQIVCLPCSKKDFFQIDG
jgi:formylmethanofuran dehydrogenase subunit E